MKRAAMLLTAALLGLVLMYEGLMDLGLIRTQWIIFTPGRRETVQDQLGLRLSENTRLTSYEDSSFLIALSMRAELLTEDYEAFLAQELTGQRELRLSEGFSPGDMPLEYQCSYRGGYEHIRIEKVSEKSDRYKITVEFFD